MLEVRHLNAAYGQHRALQDVALMVGKGEIVVILGANGAGKSTLLRAIAGVCEGSVTGEVMLDSKPLLGQTSDAIVESGLSLVPEGRGIFGDLTVRENLLLGAYTARARESERENLERVLALFPKLRERQGQVARTMSGGEQQMVAIGRAMMAAPAIMMLDEPSLGLAPKLCSELFQGLAQVKAMGIGILLVEQNARQSLAIADRGYLLENTRITLENNASALASDPAVQQAYLGGTARQPSAGIATPSIDPVAIPDTGFREARGEQRRSADQQIGGSIDDLVALAADTSARRPVTKTSPATIPSVVSAGEVSSVLQDIEKAAERARSRASSTGAFGTSGQSASTMKPQSLAASSVSTPTGNPPASSDEEPVVIEVYKRPVVEVYRRRPTGEFERQ